LKLNEEHLVQQEKVVPVSTVEAVLVIAVSFILTMLLGGLFYITLDKGLSLVLSELIILIVPLGYLLYKGVDVKRYVGLDVNPKLVLWGFVSGAILLSVDMSVSAVLLIIFGESQAVIDTNTIITELTAYPEGLIYVAIALTLAGISFIPAVLTSAFVFGLFHFDPQLVYIISALSAGLVLGYVYHHWNSYIVAVIAHSSVNILVLILLIFGY
jgi:membrane protease YdiL (CAAX protease family)